jgi:hypothetical protein
MRSLVCGIGGARRASSTHELPSKRKT